MEINTEDGDTNVRVTDEIDKELKNQDPLFVPQWSVRIPAKAAAQAALQAITGDPVMHKLLFTLAWKAIQAHGPPANQAVAAEIIQ